MLLSLTLLEPANFPEPRAPNPLLRAPLLRPRPRPLPPHHHAFQPATPAVPPSAKHRPTKRRQPWRWRLLPSAGYGPTSGPPHHRHCCCSPYHRRRPRHRRRHLFDGWRGKRHLGSASPPRGRFPGVRVLCLFRQAQRVKKAEAAAATDAIVTEEAVVSPSSRQKSISMSFYR